MSPLAVRRLLASITLTLLGAGIGTAGAAGSEPSAAAAAASVSDSTTTTTSLPTTTAIPTTTTTTIDRAARRRWEEALRADVEALVEAVSAFHAGSELAESSSVREMFDKAAEESARLRRLLDDVSNTADRLERHLPRAGRLGLDTEGHRKLVSATRLWESAQRRAADPYPCRSVLPQGAGEWAPHRLGDFQPYVDCLARKVAPLAEEVATAGEHLAEAVAALD